jgi:uncharacterized protein
MAPYLLDVRPILEEIGGSIHVADSFDMAELVVGDERFEMTQAPTVDVTISNAGEALVSIGTITAPVRTVCSRCLCSFDTEIVGEVEGYWTRPGDRAPEDEEISGAVDPEGNIDLEPALVAALVVEAPFAPIHDEDCKGLCPTCGVDLNESPCACVTDAADEGPFSALRSLLDSPTEAESDPE